MRKLSLIAVLSTLFILFYGNAPAFYAEETHSKVNGTLIQSDEVEGTTESELIDKQRPIKKPNDSKGNVFLNLPQTGESISWKISNVGSTLIAISLMAIVVKRRGYSNENK